MDLHIIVLLCLAISSVSCSPETQPISDEHVSDAAAQLNQLENEQKIMSFMRSAAPTDLSKRHIGSLVPSEYLNNLQKKHVSSLMKCKTYACMTQTFNNINQVTSDQRQKKHLGAYMKYLSSRGLSRSPGKRFFSTILQDYTPQQDDNEDVVNRHIASLLQEHDSSAIKRHIGSLVGSRSYLRPAFNSYQKRSYASLLDDQPPLQEEDPENELSDLTENEKRHLSSLMTKRFDAATPSWLTNHQSEQDKRHLSSLLQNYHRPLFPIHEPEMEKKHLGSLWSDQKRHLSSLIDKRSQDDDDMREDKRYLGSLLDETKRHLSSVVQRYFAHNQKRHLSSLLADNSDDKRAHVDKNDTPTGDHHDGTTTNGDPRPLIRKKRYLGALARNNNFPFRQSRTVAYQSAMPPATNNFIDNIENFIRQELSKQSVRDHLGMSDFHRQPLPYVSSQTDNYPAKITVMDPPQHPEQRQPNTDYYPLQDVGYFRTPNKRFLGYLARQQWFPRRYRSFVEPRFRSQSDVSGLTDTPSRYASESLRYGDAFRPNDDYFTGPAFRG